MSIDDLQLPPSFPMLSPSDLVQDATAAVRRCIEEKRRWFERAVAAGGDALQICADHSAIIDGTVAALWEHASRQTATGGRTAVLALGGWGRREMGLFCDIDLLFLHEPADGDHLRGITDGILYPLWDSGVDVGGATRTIADCRSMIGGDVRAVTAMMEARILCGDAELFAQLRKLIVTHFFDPRVVQRYVAEKLDECAARRRRFGEALYLLQPNVKEGEGGLREYHTLLWVARAAMAESGDPAELLIGALPTPVARERLLASVRFLWGVRHALHLVEGKRTDRLADAVQPAVAQKLRYVDGPRMSAVEGLMSDYYRHAGVLLTQSDRGIERIRRRVFPRSALARRWRQRTVAGGLVRTEHGTLAFADGAAQAQDPLRQLELFAAARAMHLPVDAEVVGAIADHDTIVDDETRASAEAGARWRDITAHPAGLAPVLSSMLACGLLTRWFPEMEPMAYRVQHDGFHFLTAGQHSIRAVAELAMLASPDGRRRFPREAQAFDGVERLGVLTLATFLHDIGKGRGKDHAAIGADIAAGIAGRLGLSDADQEDLHFLVRSHLLMTTLAFRRDVRDPALIERFAQTLRSPEMLSMLYLLTVADLLAIGPHVWSDWKGGLLDELYGRTAAFLAEGGATREVLARKEAERIAALCRHLGTDWHLDDVRRFLASLPGRYLLSVAPETVAAHATMARLLESQALVMMSQDRPERGCTEISIVTRDAPGLFANIAGVLSANGANIIDAQLYTTTHGVAIDVLWLTDVSGKPLTDPAQGARIREEMRRVIADGEDVDRIVEGRFKRRLLSRGQRQRPPEVLVDNDVSATDTVVEVAADDRRGLLYTVASAFHDVGCSIERARISTHVDRVTDVFYIRDADGGKIVDRERLETIRRELLGALEE